MASPEPGWVEISLPVPDPVWLLPAAALILYIVVATRCAWHSDDAYISFHESDIAAASWAVHQAQPGQRVDSLVNSVPLSFARVGEVSQFEVVPERREVRLKVDARIAPSGLIKELAALVKDFPGDAPVLIEAVTSVGPKLLELGPDYRVRPVPDFFAEAKALLGEAAVA